MKTEIPLRRRLGAWTSLRGRRRDGEELLDMPAVTLVAPILPDREEEWRRFVQEVAEERLSEYEGLRRRLGIHNESVWLARTKGGQTTMVVHLEVEDPERMASALAASEEPFDLWFKERLLECHGRDLALRRTAAEPIFAYRDVADDGRRPEDSGRLLREGGQSYVLGGSNSDR
jgi:hypothetical protein